MANLLSENFQYITICIEDDVGAIAGTGFLVGDTPISEDKYGRTQVSWRTPKTRAYLVTARHVLGSSESVIRETYSYGLRYTAKTEAGLEFRSAPFRIVNDPPNWAVHPNESIDVAALDVTDWLSAATDGSFRFCPLSELANPLNLLRADSDAGDDIFVLGYPLTLRQGRTGLPLVRKGVLATSPRRSLQEEDGTPLRGFLIDGAILPGSSGSPVVGASSGRFIAGDLGLTPWRPLVLGVVAQEWGRGKLARYNARSHKGGKPNIEGYANLGFAHSASTIIETTSVLGHHTQQDFLRLDHDEFWAPALGTEEWALECDGREVDAEVVDRIMRRLHRDRMRSRGYTVEPDDSLDALEIMGPLPQAGSRS